MSKNKHRLHDRAMQLLHRCGTQGMGVRYCGEGGIGPCKELDYLLERGLVLIVRLHSDAIQGSKSNVSLIMPAGSKYIPQKKVVNNNLYHAHPLMVNSGTYWRCDHGRTGFGKDMRWIGCPKCAKADPDAYERFKNPTKVR